MMPLNNTTQEAKLCECGCGQPTWIATETRPKKQWIKGQPVRFLRGHGQGRPITERFWEKVDKRDPDQCWPWKGGHTATGRGVLRASPIHGKEKIVATHVSWELHYGPMPDGVYVLHKCDNPACVNPAHLWLGTQSDNMTDMYSKGRGR